VVQRFAPAFSRGDGYPQVFLDLLLPGEVVKAAGAEAGVKGYILFFGLAGSNALYLWSSVFSLQKSSISGGPLKST
jgi:hypothetical protein